MGVRAILLLLATAPIAAAEEGLSLPSGKEVRLMEVIQNTQGTEGLAIRYRFVAEGLVDADYEQVAGDLFYLCNSYAIPRLSVIGPQPAQIIVSLSDQEIAFGDTDPDVIQYFGAYRVTGSSCEEEAL